MTSKALESNRIGSTIAKTFADDIEDLYLVTRVCRELNSMFNLIDAKRDEEYYPVLGQRSIP